MSDFANTRGRTEGSNLRDQTIDAIRSELERLQGSLSSSVILVTKMEILKKTEALMKLKSKLALLRIQLLGLVSLVEILVVHAFRGLTPMNIHPCFTFFLSIGVIF